MSRTQAYTLAHTARCKLQLAADRPDRNLRFILGHAFTLDNLRVRIAEIETDSSASLSDSSDDEDLPACNANVGSVGKPRRVSFQGGSPRPTNLGVGRPKSPPPDELAQLSSSESEDEDDDIEEDDEFEEELSLTRFESATAKAPRMVPDDEDDEDDGDLGPKSPEMLPSEGDLKIITGQEGNQELEEAYRSVNGCLCHGKHGPHVDKVWEIPGQKGENGGRMAVVQIAA
jgi:hypothetical protein